MVVKLNVFGLSSTPAAGSLVKTGLSCLKIKSETFLISLSIGFAEQSKTSVVHMCSLFHAFILCQLWTVYLEQTIGKLVLKTYVFYSYYAMHSLMMLIGLSVRASFRSDVFEVPFPVTDFCLCFQNRVFA